MDDGFAVEPEGVDGAVAGLQDGTGGGEVLAAVFALEGVVDGNGFAEDGGAVAGGAFPWVEEDAGLVAESTGAHEEVGAGRTPNIVAAPMGKDTTLCAASGPAMPSGTGMRAPLSRSAAAATVNVMNNVKLQMGLIFPPKSSVSICGCICVPGV